MRVILLLVNVLQWIFKDIYSYTICKYDHMRVGFYLLEIIIIHTH